MSVRGIVCRTVGTFVGSRIAEETGNRGSLGGLVGLGLTMLARRSPLGLVTVGGLYLGKKYLDGRNARAVQPVLPLAGGGVTDKADRFENDLAGKSDVEAATDARDPAFTARA